MSKVEKIIFVKTARGWQPDSAWDAEQLDEMPIGARIEAKRYRLGPNKAMNAWWLLCSRVAGCIEDGHNARSVSDAMLIDLGHVSRVELFGGGAQISPRSLQNYTDDDLWKLVEAGKKHVVEKVIPGVNLEELLKVVKR